MPKDVNCPNCHGESESSVEPVSYYLCELCETPDEQFINWWCSDVGRLKEYREWKALPSKQKTY